MTNYTVNFYTPSGQKLGAYTLTPTFVYQNGTYVAELDVVATSNDEYFGSRRLATLDRLGSAGRQGIWEGTYYPWGEDKGGTSPQDTWNYATYWRDSVSGLDYANNRYYSNAYGRFMTPDPAGFRAARPGDPGSWNRYAYTPGDPVNGNDPSGLDGYFGDLGVDWGYCDSGCLEQESFAEVGTYAGPTAQQMVCQSLIMSFAQDGGAWNPGCGAPTTTGSLASPPPCQDDWGNVDQTLESLGTNILSIAEQKIQGLTSQETSALSGTIQGDITSEMNTIMAAGTGNTSPPFFQGGHYNLDITNGDITADLGADLGNQFITDFTVGFFGTLDGVRQSAPNQPGYTLHSKAAGNQVDFHFDRFGYRNLPGHWGYDVGYGSFSHACLDPAWQH